MKEKKEINKSTPRHIMVIIKLVKPVIKSSKNQRKSLLAAAAESLQSGPTLCDPIEGSPQGSAVPGILQARTLEWTV